MYAEAPKILNEIDFTDKKKSVLNHFKVIHKHELDAENIVLDVDKANWIDIKKD